MNYISYAIGGAVFALLSACTSGPNPQSLQTDPNAPPSVEAARTIFANRTMITHGIHGTQIEYHRPDGRSFLWYPGNAVSVPAKWEVRPYLGRKSHEICWQYPSRSKNGITGLSSGGRWQCTPSQYFFSSVKEVLEGDPFNLASGRVPYRLQRDRLTARQLIGPTRRSPASLQYVLTK